MAPCSRKIAVLKEDVRIMRIARHIALALIAAGFWTGGVVGAQAQSLKEARAKEASNAALEREAIYTRQVCGSSLLASIDWASTSRWPSDADLVAKCDGALGAIETVCRKKNTRAAAQSISRFVCAGDGKGAELNGATLRYGAAPDANGFYETHSVLKKEFGE